MVRIVQKLRIFLLLQCLLDNWILQKSFNVRFILQYFLLSFLTCKAIIDLSSSSQVPRGFDLYKSQRRGQCFLIFKKTGLLSSRKQRINIIHKMSVKCSYSSSTMIQTGLEINSFLMAINAILSLVHQFLHTCNNTVRDVFNRFIYTYTAQKWSFPFRISSVNVTKSAVSCEFGHIYWRNP